MADVGTPDWWLTRLYRHLYYRRPRLKQWDDWYTGNHPAPQGYEKATALLGRILEATGLNILAVVTDAAHERLAVEGFKIGGQVNDDVWEVWQGNNFDLAFSQIELEKMIQAESFALVDPNLNRRGYPTMTPEHPEQCVVEYEPGSREIAAGLKVWQDDLVDPPVVRAMVYLPDQVYAYAARTQRAMVHNRAFAYQPSWELQPEKSGDNPLGEVPIVPFRNRPRMMHHPKPEFEPAIIPQRRINKTLLDRLAMQDAGAFKALWATGMKIPDNPNTGEPVEDFVKAIDRVFVNENPDGKFGQFEAEDIRQILQAVSDDIKHAAIVVPTPPDQILGELVNISADGLKSAQASLITRVRRHQRDDEESAEALARLVLKAAGKDVPNSSSMTTIWRNPEYRTEGQAVDAGLKALQAGLPYEAVWEKYFGATPQEIAQWKTQLAEQQATDPLLNAANALTNSNQPVSANGITPAGG